MYNIPMLTKLRKFMQMEGVSVFVVNTTDEYLSEYVDVENNSLYQITGFSGSTGEALVTQDTVLLFVDGRYHLQAETQTNPAVVSVVKVRLESSPKKEMFSQLEEISRAGEKVGIVSTKTSCTEFKQILKILEEKPGIIIAEYEFDPICPENQLLELTPLVSLPDMVSGMSDVEKLHLVKNYMQGNNIDFLLITKLEEIAYLTNKRGTEIPFSSSFKAWAAVYNGKLHVFRKKNEFESFLSAIHPENIYFTPSSTSFSIYRKFEKQSNKLLEINESYISELKSVKTQAELDYMRECYMKTDIVMNRTICWLNQNLENGVKITEKDLNEKVKNLFTEEGAIGLSFETITASGENTAFIHYTSPDEKKLINSGDLVLIDCGAYFEYGYATDQTRTFLAGGCTAKADTQVKQVYTAVLKGFLNGLYMEIDANTTGFDLDKKVRDIVDANKPECFSFSHATGHGIGISVHESPPRIGTSELSKVPFKTGMCFTIEPGLYSEGKGGVRLENTVTLVEENGVRRIKTLTRSAFDENLIDYNMLTAQEIEWLKQYNAQKVG